MMVLLMVILSSVVLFGCSEKSTKATYNDGDKFTPATPPPGFVEAQMAKRNVAVDPKEAAKKQQDAQKK